MQMAFIFEFVANQTTYDSYDVRNFSHKPSSDTAFIVLQTMAQKITEAECVDKMWNQYSFFFLKSSCILNDLAFLYQLRNHELTCTREKRNLLPGMLFGRGTCCKSSPRFRFRETRRFVRQSVQSMNMPKVKLNIKWHEHLEQHRHPRGARMQIRHVSWLQNELGSAQNR